MLSPFSMILCAGAIAFGETAAAVMLAVAAANELVLAVGRLRGDGRA